MKSLIGWVLLANGGAVLLLMAIGIALGVL